jgi:hypothetical protein
MKWRLQYFQSAIATGSSVALMVTWSAAAAPPAQTAAPEVVARSVFVMPTNPKEGRDPFFPESSRPYQSAMAGQPHVGNITSLVLKGVSGPPDHRLAIINNHTFAVGDAQDLITSQGRVHVRCVEIKDGSVVIESGGANHELKYTDTP